MILLFFLLSLDVTFGFSFKGIDYTTTIYKNNKLYVYEPDDIELKWSGLTIYNLSDGPISDIQTQLVNFTNSNPVYTPQFLQLPQGLPNGRSNETWMIGGIVDDKLKDNNLIKENWTCEILNDNKLKFHDDFIPMPQFRNFPKSGFSQTIVNSNNGPELYIVGGLVYVKELDKELITNYFYKYEFNTGKWVDLSKATKSILQPRAYHKVIEVDNSLLLFGGIQNDEAIKENFEHTTPTDDNTDYGGITTIFKFDLKDQKWSTVNAKLNKDPNIYKTGQVSGSVFNIYNGKIISYISLYNYDRREFEPQIGILNYNTWEWEWHNVKNEAGTDNNLILSYYQTLIINDQLILIHGMSNQRQVKKLYVINLETYKFQGFLNISGEDSKSESSGLPSWAVTISVLGIWFCLRFKKQVKVDDANSEQAIQEVWASAGHENDGLKSRAAPFPSSKMGKTGGLNDSILIDELAPRFWIQSIYPFVAIHGHSREHEGK
ncbi:hypothetical protein CONCODRAFT_14119 [Conidiobolus coronatus NRRL 28638]|uniref:Galactose oxidase n=1 Tax=Conidiobolus coronatus (strain ATCC 28846 / CBS 209.66 / NRRL 28638) TaxID=796925 RepID=A0A137NPM2_CONC2|nr:hypothetical protein CONCODRAFT_14119 [Conidiobolus coronatus NRRL 28638]|eukprot:KXN64684.1 hypothetical protein CONCODRAFT_14119 [Conidiobolus coronatus NRRL 28638]